MAENGKSLGTGIAIRFENMHWYWQYFLQALLICIGTAKAG